MPTDAFEMALVHRVFRDQLNLAPQLISSVRPWQRRRMKVVAGHITNVLVALHHHHVAEDELLWPTLHARVPLRSEDIHRMETEHSLIAKLVSSVELRLAEWMTAPDSPVAQSQAAETLISEITALRESVSDHLGAEEDRVVPLINENLTDAEWRAVTERGAAFLSGRNIWFGIAFVGTVLEACTTDERRRFLAGMPPQKRLLVRLCVRRVAASYRTRLERTR
ncbi:hypothetical protein A5626_22520 [Mycobacterium marseillense]|uniref:hemerythrin domain-containing protein n=1 Tax=Mycobacterium marseillense TaxID=701042 RepID=UPI0008015E9B|nr:hemerythrin domain-containing protein [Mycobacterium marseillense]MCA2264604.1 hemerythrin domain-containing protein [Mycobacterium marseillense]OBJ73239.1 hypothetical protein A5626_22520 [Mycobacterium marseillense]